MDAIVYKRVKCEKVKFSDKDHLINSWQFEKGNFYTVKRCYQRINIFFHFRKNTNDSQIVYHGLFNIKENVTKSA